MDNTFRIPGKLSPLDQIRQTEAEMTRSVAQARESADQRLANEKEKAKDKFLEARSAGNIEGRARYQRILSEAEETAHTIIRDGESAASELRRRGRQRMPDAVLQALNIVIGLFVDGENL